MQVVDILKSALQDMEEEDRVLRIITHAKCDDLMLVFGPNLGRKIHAALQDKILVGVDDLLGLPQIGRARASKLIEYAYDVLEEKARKKRERKISREMARLRNRTRYLPHPTITFYETDEGLQRCRGDVMLRSKGLLALALEHEGFKGLTSIQILNCLPPAQGGNERHEPIPEEFWLRCYRNGFAVSGQRLALNWNSPVKRWLLKCFPNAVECRAYVHGLNSPVFPGGFMPDTEVYLKKVPEGSDGSGRIHPEHPLFEQMHLNPCIVQIRCIKPPFFAKGILVPDERCKNEDGSPAIWIDPSMVKGAMKERAKQRHGDTPRFKTHLGVIGLWSRPAKLRWSFEILENVKLNADTVKLVRELTEEGVEELLGGGPEEILRRAAKQVSQGENVALLLALCEELKIPPLSIDMLNELFKDSLGRILYHLAQGCGQSSRQMVPVIDETLKPGTCVAGGFPLDTEVAIYRYPLVLAQGLVICKTVAPSEHHLVNGRIVKNAIFLHPEDLCLRMQGDDDGDFVGVTDDPRAVELFKQRIDDNLYKIEVEGYKMHIPLNSPQGFKYLNSKPRGPVGLFTVLRSQFLAVGDLAAANAMSLLIQEAVDRPKRRVRCSDWAKVAELGFKQVDGVYVNTYRHDKDAYQDEQELVEAVMAWASARMLTRHGVAPQQDVAAWRLHRGRIDPDDWQRVTELGHWTGGNLVHVVHEYARKLCQEKLAEWQAPDTEPVSLHELLPNILKQKGYDVECRILPWEEYVQLRRLSGLEEYGREMQRIMNQDLIQDGDKGPDIMARLERIQNAERALHARLHTIAMAVTCQFFVDIWVNEIWHESGNRNHAFRAIAWPGSPILSMLGIEHKKPCAFLTPKRITAVVEKCLGSEEPFQTLEELILNSTQHAKEVKDEDGEPIHGYNCEDCKSTLYESVVRALRRKRMMPENRMFSELIPRLNGRK